MLQTENKIPPVVAVLASSSYRRSDMSVAAWRFYRVKWLVCYWLGWKLKPRREYPSCVELAWFNYWSDGDRVATDVATVGRGLFVGWWYDVDTILEVFDE